MDRGWGFPGTIVAGDCPVGGSVVDKVAIDAAIDRIQDEKATVKIEKTWTDQWKLILLTRRQSFENAIQQH